MFAKVEIGPIGVVYMSHGFVNITGGAGIDDDRD